MILVSSCSCLCSIHCNQVLSWEWRWSEGSTILLPKVSLTLEIWQYILVFQTINRNNADYKIQHISFIFILGHKCQCDFIALYLKMPQKSGVLSWCVNSKLKATASGDHICRFMEKRTSYWISWHCWNNHNECYYKILDIGCWFFFKNHCVYLLLLWIVRAGLMSCQSRGERQCFSLSLWCIDHIDRWTCHSASAKLNAMGHARNVQGSGVEFKWPRLDKISKRE